MLVVIEIGGAPMHWVLIVHPVAPQEGAEIAQVAPGAGDALHAPPTQAKLAEPVIPAREFDTGPAVAALAVAGNDAEQLLPATVQDKT